MSLFFLFPFLLLVMKTFIKEKEIRKRRRTEQDNIYMSIIPSFIPQLHSNTHPRMESSSLTIDCLTLSTPYMAKASAIEFVDLIKQKLRFPRVGLPLRDPSNCLSGIAFHSKVTNIIHQEAFESFKDN